ncbi:MAG: hypothetical protein JW807_08730 [Spirochaetes bacterium]|nr:hypothetical protein [Spirochaetota bacterium]
MAEQFVIRVETYSGYKADERPMTFILGETRHEVSEIIDRWYGPDYRYFKVRADDGCVYILKYDESRDRWELGFYDARG